VNRDPVRLSCAGPTGPVSYLQWGGSGAPLMFLHPVNTAGEIWVDLMDHLDHPAIALDYRGHGSSGRQGPFLPADYAADALAAMDAAGLDRGVLVGASVGGAVSVELAVAAPGRVAGIALFGAALSFDMDEAALDEAIAGLRRLGVEEWFRTLSGSILGPDASPALPDRIATLAGGRPTELIEEILRGTFLAADSRPAAHAVQTAGPPPALVVAGTHDPTCPTTKADELAGYLVCPCVVMDQIGHLPMLEAPKESAVLLSNFLATAFPEERD
jgi:pimeloyl-ACP methyl ester carboxylesterase